jgi:hypothetical protein
MDSSPICAINRMLVSDRVPSKSWADRLTSIFGTSEWQERFYKATYWPSILDENEKLEFIRKVTDERITTEFFIEWLQTKFANVVRPGYFRNSKGLLFVLLFAGGNERGATTGVKIANDLISDLDQTLFG